MAGINIDLVLHVSSTTAIDQRSLTPLGRKRDRMKAIKSFHPTIFERFFSVQQYRLSAR